MVPGRTGFRMFHVQSSDFINSSHLFIAASPLLLEPFLCSSENWYETLFTLSSSAIVPYGQSAAV